MQLRTPLVLAGDLRITMQKHKILARRWHLHDPLTPLMSICGSNTGESMTPPSLKDPERRLRIPYDQ